MKCDYCLGFAQMPDDPEFCECHTFINSKKNGTAKEKYRYILNLSNLVYCESFEIELFEKVITGFNFKFWREPHTGCIYYNKPFTNRQIGEIHGFASALIAYCDEDDFEFSSWSDYDTIQYEE